MKKTVVTFLHGFGIEQKKSYAIYDSFLMPNLDAYSKSYHFTTLDVLASDYMQGFQLFSTGNMINPTIGILDQKIQNGLLNDPDLCTFLKNLESFHGKIHMFCVMNQKKVLDHVQKYLMQINKDKKYTIYLHVIVDYASMDNYEEMENILRKFNYELEGYAILKIVVGKNFVLDKEKGKEIVRLLYRGFGEQWRELSKKVGVLKKEHTLPRDIKPFCIDAKFSLDDQDMIFFFNYERENFNNFISLVTNPDSFMNSGKTIRTLNICSLFPMDGNYYTIYKDASSKASFGKFLKDNQLTSLHILDFNKINKVNFYLNGYQNINNASLKYVAGNEQTLYDPNMVKQLISDTNENYIFFHYFIDEVKTEKECKDLLRKIDGILKEIATLCEEKEYTFVLSSLYGMKKNIVNDRNQEVIVNFHSKVPFIFHAKEYSKESYQLIKGTTFDFAKTLIYLGNPNFHIIPLIEKKSSGGFFTIFKK